MPMTPLVAKARKAAARAVENGDVEIKYRGVFFTVEDDRSGWTYVFDGDEYTSLAAVLNRIDGLVQRPRRR